METNNLSETQNPGDFAGSSHEVKSDKSDIVTKKIKEPKKSRDKSVIFPTTKNILKKCWSYGKSAIEF